MSMREHKFDVGASKPAEGMSGRIYALDEKNAKLIKPDSMVKKSEQWSEIAKAGSQIPQFAGSEINKLKSQIPEFNDLHARAVAKSVANEYGHFASVLEAKTKGLYRTAPTADGGTQTGITSEAGREGLWIERDKDNRVREIGSFAGGKPSGAFREYRQDGSLEQSSYFKDGIQTGQAYKYNEKSEAIQRTEFEGGKAKETVAIDPVAVKKAAAERRADFAAQQNFTISR